MAPKQSKFRAVALFALISACSVLSIAALAIVWSFDYFGWHSRVNWTLHAKAYKAKVLSESSTADGSLRHLEWEGWGFPGAGDTITYLVFDPSDQLLPASDAGRAGKYPGVPCEVVRVRQLEKNWYTVRFYTEQDWNHCD